jgi:hypothetical protein
VVGWLLTAAGRRAALALLAVLLVLGGVWWLRDNAADRKSVV